MKQSTKKILAQVLMEKIPARSLKHCESCEQTHVCCSQEVRILCGEVDKIKKLGGKIHYDLSTGSYFMNRNNALCDFFIDGGCSIYVDRPSNCKTFNCLDSFQILGGNPAIKALFNSTLWAKQELVNRGALK